MTVRNKPIISSVNKKSCIDSRRCKNIDFRSAVSQFDDESKRLEIYCLCDGLTHIGVWLNEDHELMVRYAAGPSFGIFEKIRINGIEHVVHGVTSIKNHLLKNSYVSVYVTPCYEMPWSKS